MAITLEYIYETAGLDRQEIYDVPVDFSAAFCTLSLDACEPLYGHLYLPLSFTKKSKLTLQEALVDARFDSRSHVEIERAVLEILQRFEKKMGLDATHELTEWMLCADNYHAAGFVRDLGYIINDIERGRIQIKLPLRLERFYAMKDLLQPVGYPYPEEALLEPDKLKSKWDVKHYAAHYDRIEEHNGWNPSDWAGCAAKNMQDRIAWENAMKGPAPDEAELDAIYHWVDTHRSKTKMYGSQDFYPAHNPRSMFISPRLREEYQVRGIIQK